MKPFSWSFSCSCILVGLLVCSSRGGAAETDNAIEIDPLVQQAEQSRIEAIEKAKPSAVSVFVPGGAGGGSGVLISPEGYALTNFHVTSPAGSFMRCGLSDGKIYDAVIVGIDPVGDLAMIRLLGRDDFPYAELGDSLSAQPGDWCMVIGNPFLLASNLQPTVTWGILSGVGRYQYPSGTLLEYGDCLQTDASINPGNSGGPLYDATGKLLGIVGRASFEKRGRVNVGVGYAISINQAKNFLGYLHSGRIVDHATLGATVATDPDGGVTVSNILESSDAYRRGLRYGSEILEIDGRVVQTANDVQNVLATYPSNWRVKLTYREQGETFRTLVRLQSVHRPDELLEKMSGALPPPPPRPKPQPEDQDDGDNDDKQDGSSDEDAEPETPKPAPSPHALPGMQIKNKVPQAVREQLEERRGYANYHFNEIQQQQFIDALRNQNPGGDASESVAWKIVAETEGEQPQEVNIFVSDTRTAFSLGEQSFESDSRSQLYDAVSEGSIAGILPALDAWRRMIEQGPKKFGETFYLGSMPLGGERPLRDTIIGIDGELEIRWLSHPESKRVEAIEVFADRDRDPAELWLLTEGDDDADGQPTVMDLRYGTESVIRLRIKSWERIAEDSPQAAVEEKSADEQQPTTDSPATDQQDAAQDNSAPDNGAVE